MSKQKPFKNIEKNAKLPHYFPSFKNNADSVNIMRGTMFSLVIQMFFALQVSFYAIYNLKF